MKVKLLCLLVLACTVTPMAWAQCLTPELTPGGPLSRDATQQIEFEPVEGAATYQVEVRHPSRELWYVLGRTDATTFTLPAVSLPFDDQLRMRVVAQSAGQSRAEICSAELTVQVEPDLELRKDVGRVVIPVAGSLEGAFGSQWRTMLSMSNNLSRSLAGTIIFHPAGSIASDQDPSMGYDLAPGEVVQWEDVVSALGATGLGTIDVIPDSPDVSSLGERVPTIQTRVVNESENGTFGTAVKEVFVGDLVPNQLGFRPAPFYQSADLGWGIRSEIILPPDYGVARINIGFRYFGFEELYNIFSYDPQDSAFVQLAIRRDGEVIETVWRTASAGFFEQVRLEDVFDSELEAGDVILIRGVAALTYWTLTDNRTNDPSFHFDIHSGDAKRITFQ